MGNFPESMSFIKKMQIIADICVYVEEPDLIGALGELNMSTLEWETLLNELTHRYIFRMPKQYIFL